MEQSFLIRGDFIFSDREGKLKELPDSVLLVKDGIVCGGFSADELPDDFEKLKNGEVHFPETDSVFSAGDAGQQIDTEQGMTDLRGLAYYNFRGRLIIPGFTDLHLHAPQYAFRGMRMDHELLEWLNYSAFPEEARFRSADYARKAYRLFADDLKRGASTRAVIFATLHTDATLELMRLLEDTGLVTMVGKVNMDRNCPPYLTEKNAEESLRETVRWLNACGLNLKEEDYACGPAGGEPVSKAAAGKRSSGQAGDGKQPFSRTFAILTPRFIPACTDELSRGLGRIAKDTGLPVQSHLDENRGEVSWVKELVPESESYTDAYDRMGLLGGPDSFRSVMAHCVWCSDEEIRILKDRDVFLAHCPTSNSNLGSGIAPVTKYIDRRMKLGIGTDIGAGHAVSMIETVRQAVQVSKLYRQYIDENARPLTMAEAFWLGTMGGASFFCPPAWMNRGKKASESGSFLPGYTFDALVLDESQLRTWMENLTLTERLERFLYLADDRDIAHKFAAGRRIF